MQDITIASIVLFFLLPSQQLQLLLQVFLKEEELLLPLSCGTKRRKNLKKLVDAFKRLAGKTVGRLSFIMGRFVTYMGFGCFCCRLYCVMGNAKSKEPEIEKMFKTPWYFQAIKLYR